MYPQKVKVISDTKIKIEFNNLVFDTTNAFYEKYGEMNLSKILYISF